MSIRLNKFLADRGVASRRASDRLIEDGRVRINGRVVTDLGTKVEEERDKVSVNGKPVGGRERHVYFVLNKPVGFITTLDDPEGRHTVRELMPRGARVYPVGRLDADTSGLLLLTNDGDLAHKLMHPRYGVAKTYRVRLAREPRPEQLRRLTTGVRFDRGKISGLARARRIDPGFDAIMIEVVVHEGRFRQVRKMCEAVGLEVTGLHRVGYGPIRLGPLARGMFRELSADEVTKLRAESSRAGRGAPPRAGEAAARPKPATRPAPARNDEDEEIEETWVPGGGLLEPDDEDEFGGGEPPSRPAERGARPAGRRPSEWPARAGERRGDDDFKGPAPGRTPRREVPQRREKAQGRGGTPRREGAPRREGPQRRENAHGLGRTPRREGAPRREGPQRGEKPQGRGSTPRREGAPRREGPQRRESAQARWGTPRRDGPPRRQGPQRGVRSGGAPSRGGRSRGGFAESHADRGQRRGGTRKPSRRGPR